MGPGSVLDHYIFTDSSGAEYSLDVNTGGIWTSKEGIYVEYDANANRLYFPDGSFWVMGSISGGTEQDSGTRYPTLMQDTNGNQIIIRYRPGVGLSQANTSARISEIEDVRATGYGPYLTYSFTYNTDSIPHLTGITNQIGTSEGYTFTYLAAQPLSSPFDGVSHGTTTFLRQVYNSPLNETRTFDYNGSGELLKLTLPRGGWLRWTYRPFTFSGGSTIREVDNRYLAKSSSSGETKYAFTHDDAGDAGQPAHSWTTVADPTGAAKTWTFSQTGTYAGLLTQYEGKVSPTGAALHRQSYTWTQDDAGRAYIGAVLTTADPGQSYEKQSKTEQSLDRHGNVLWTKLYNFGNLTTPARTYTNTYLADGNYTSRHMWNRLLTSTVTNGSQTVTLVTNTYDGGTLTSRAGMREHDTAYTAAFVYRGNVTRATTPGAIRNITYDINGAVDKVDDGYNHTVAYTPADGTNFAAPGAITPNNDPNLTSTITYNAFLGVTSTNTPGAGSTSTSYDGAARPSRTTTRFGAVSQYTYYSNYVYKTTGASRAEEIYLDGLGRTVKQVVHPVYGYSGTTSTVEYEYDSCACSPFGKLKRVSQPYATGQTPIWTTYTYDALGRTTRVDLPGGSGAILYSYQGNQTTVTDPGGKWKRYTVDAMGNLAQATEPAPEGGTHETYYTYNVLNQLTQVSMPRGGTTQVRSFNYDLTTGRLMSTTNPENGTVSYTYNPDGTLASKTDAKNQRTDYTYDTATQRLTREGVGTDLWRNYTYNDKGQVATVEGSGAWPWTVSYSYTAAGQISGKQLSIANGDLYAGFTYDMYGQIKDVRYPTYWYEQEDPNTGEVTYLQHNGDSYVTDQDGLYRPVALRRSYDNRNMVWDVSYGVSGQMLGMSYLASVKTSLTGRVIYPTYRETRTYNDRLQMTRMTVTGTADPNDIFAYTPPPVDLEYRFSATANDGRITQMKDWVTGEEVNYAYDTLGRLSSAVTTGPEWGLSFSYDGFGNLTSEVPTKGSAPTGYFNYDATTNRLAGTGYTYDANGNLTATPGGMNMYYDAWNRKTGPVYGPGNERIMDGTSVFLYGPDGKLLGTYAPDENGRMFMSEQYVYFAGRLVWKDKRNGTGSAVVTDRLGSSIVDQEVRHTYYPYGEARTGISYNTTAFATYYRQPGNLDYAYNRYYSTQFMRFTSPDPYMASGGPADPQSWNRYSYVGGDPVNFNDPSGLSPDPAYVNDDPWPMRSDGLCFLDGNLVGCEFASHFVENGAAVGCPGNFCGGWAKDGDGGGIAYVQFSADAGGSQGYSNLAPWIGDPASPENQIHQAFLLAAKKASIAIDPNSPQDVRVKLVGMTYNVQIPQNRLASAEGFKDPFTFLHDGNDSYYLATINLFGFNVGHVVRDDAGIEAHYDSFGPFNPFHYTFETLPSFFINPKGSNQSWYTCTINGGCEPTPKPPFRKGGR